MRWIRLFFRDAVHFLQQLRGIPVRCEQREQSGVSVLLRRVLRALPTAVAQHAGALSAGVGGRVAGTVEGAQRRHAVPGLQEAHREERPQHL